VAFFQIDTACLFCILIIIIFLNLIFDYHLKFKLITIEQNKKESNLFMGPPLPLPVQVHPCGRFHKISRLL